MEIWKDIKNYEGLYQVSNFGRIKALERTVQGRWGEQHLQEKILALYKDKKGYMIAYLYKNNIKKALKVHRIVAEAFLQNLDNKREIDHINRIKDDNRVENLRWVTAKENSANRNTINTEKAKRKRAKYVVSVKNNRISIYRSSVSASKRLGIKSSPIGQCCNSPKRHKTYKGYRWLYLKRYYKNTTLRLK